MIVYVYVIVNDNVNQNLIVIAMLRNAIQKRPGNFFACCVAEFLKNF